MKEQYGLLSETFRLFSLKKIEGNWMRTRVSDKNQNNILNSFISLLLSGIMCDVLEDREVNIGKEDFVPTEENT